MRRRQNSGRCCTLHGIGLIERRWSAAAVRAIVSIKTSPEKERYIIVVAVVAVVAAVVVVVVVVLLL